MLLLLWISLVFWECFLHIFKDFKGSQGQKILDVSEGLLRFIKKPKEKKDRVSCSEEREFSVTSLKPFSFLGKSQNDVKRHDRFPDN